MGDLSKNFSRWEVRCKCNRNCGCDTMDVETIKLAEVVRDFVGGPVQCTSGHRCEDHNRDIGGAKRSLHTFGRAMDLIVPNPKKVYDHLCTLFPGRYGFGLYTKSGFVHVDSRTDGPARWGS